MTVPDPSMTFSLAPKERPLGIQQPLLPSAPLGQSLLQPKFLSPLGARSLTVLDPAVFRSTEQSTAFDWQSPFQDSPFFDAPEPRATNPPSQPPTLQTRSLDSTNSVNRSTASSGADVEAPPALNLRSEPAIDDAIAGSLPTPEFTAPAVETQTPAETVVSEASFAEESEPLVNRSALDGADVIETMASSTAETNQVAADHEASQPIGRPLPSSALPVPASTPSTNTAADLPSPPSLTEASAPAIARLVSEESAAEPASQQAVELSVPAIQLRPDVLPVEPTAPEEARSPSNLETATPDVSVPETSATIAPVVSEPFTTASDTQPAPDSTPLDSTPLDPTPSIATEPASNSSELLAIAFFPQEDATAVENTTATEPTRSDSVIQPSPAEPTASPTIAPVPAPDALLSEVLLSEAPLSEEAFPALATPSDRQELDSDPSSDASLNAASVETNLFSAPELPTTNPITNTVQTKLESDEALEPIVDRPVDRVNDGSEAVQMKLATDATRDDGSEAVQRNPNHAEEQPAEFPAPESDALNDAPLDATVIAPTAAMQSDRSVEPTVEPSITTQAAIQTKGSESTAPLLEGAASDASIAGNVVLPRNSPEPLAISALESEALESEALESNSLLSTDTSKPLVQDGIETVTQPLIQPKIEASAAPAIASLPVIPEVTSADLVQHDASETPPFSTTEPDSTIPTSPVQNSGMAMESVQRQPVELAEIAPLDAVADVPEAVSPEATLSENASLDRYSALPELPTAIQRLSVWEPLVQMQPLVASVASPAIQPSQTARYPDAATSQPQTFDRPADPLSTLGSDGFDPVLLRNVGSLNDTVSLKAEAVPTEWSSIAELFQSTEAATANTLQSDTIQRSAPQSTAHSDLANGYTDLNLRSDNTALPDVIQRELETPPGIAVPAAPMPDAEPTSGQPSPPSQPQPPQASPEQLERLAQEIYKLVRQRLAVERERGGNLYPRRSM